MISRLDIGILDRIGVRAVSIGVMVRLGLQKILIKDRITATSSITVLMSNYHVPSVL